MHAVIFLEVIFLLCLMCPHRTFIKLIRLAIPFVSLCLHTHAALRKKKFIKTFQQECQRDVFFAQDIGQ